MEKLRKLMQDVLGNCVLKYIKQLFKVLNTKNFSSNDVDAPRGLYFSTTFKGTTVFLYDNQLSKIN